MSKTSEMKEYEVKIWNSATCKREYVTIKADRFSTDSTFAGYTHGQAHFWIGGILVAAFPKEGWYSVVEK